MTTKDDAALTELERGMTLILEGLKRLRTSEDWVDQYNSPLGKRRHLALVRSGQLEGHKVERLVLVRRGDLDAFIKRHRVEPKDGGEDVAEEAEIDRLVSGRTLTSRRRKSA